tara:strand:- start:961 stop:2184 length:1224 start_codon:yes stop_codon:yes gene_type:complete
MELALIRSLMNKDFYEDHKGIRCPDKLFTKDVRKIKQTVDYAMSTFDKDLSVSELHGLFMTNNSTMTTATKESYNQLFDKLKNEKPMCQDISKQVFSKLFQQMVGEEIANLGFDYVNGDKGTLEPLRNLLSTYQDDFLPNLNIEWEDMSIDALLKANAIQCQWKFNIPTLQRRVEGVSGGHLVIIGARPNTGKTSFHASLIASKGGFAEQGAKCIILCNEEAYDRVGARYLSAATNMSMDEVRQNVTLASARYKPVRENIYVKDTTGKDMAWVESAVKAMNPDIVVLDMGDKFAPRTGERSDIYLKEAAIHARNIAKQYNCAILWMSQLSAEAEGKIMVDQSMLEGSKTGKASEADLMLLISKNPTVEGQEDEDTERHVVIAKNKLKGGWHGVVTVQLDGERARFTA